MDLQKRDIRGILVTYCKTWREAAENDHDINEPFGNEMTSGWLSLNWFKRFRGGDLNLDHQ